MRYKEFDPHGLINIRKQLIKKKGSTDQKSFLKIACDSCCFEKWLDENLSVSNNEGSELPCYPEKITEGEFRELPALVERTAFDHWTGLTPREACRSSFWGYVTANHIRERIIESHYLALNGKENTSGKGRIADALKDNDTEEIDKVVRTILRRFSGLPEARGGLRSVSVDCTLARAWWRERLLREVAEVGGIDKTAISDTLRYSQTYWEKLITMIISRNSVFGDSKVRTALIWALADHIDKPQYAGLRKGPQLDQCIRMLGVWSAWQELAVFEVEEILQIIDSKIFKTILG